MVNSVNNSRIPSNTRRGVKHVQYGPDCEALNRYRVMSQVVYSNICTDVISTFPTYSIYALIKLQKTRNCKGNCKTKYMHQVYSTLICNKKTHVLSQTVLTTTVITCFFFPSSRNKWSYFRMTNIVGYNFGLQISENPTEKFILLIR